MMASEIFYDPKASRQVKLASPFASDLSYSLFNFQKLCCWVLRRANRTIVTLSRALLISKWTMAQHFGWYKAGQEAGVVGAIIILVRIDTKITCSFGSSDLTLLLSARPFR
jgi:hypothetical protein